jgi:hypothetical protein
MATMRKLLLLCAALLASSAAGAEAAACAGSGRACDASKLCCAGFICDRFPGTGSEGVCKKSSG